ASEFRVTTGQITVRPESHCLFSVWTDGTTSRVTSARGEVSASADAETPLKITAGYFFQWPTASKEPIAASADANAQMDIKTAVEVEGIVVDQAGGWGRRRFLKNSCDRGARSGGGFSPAATLSSAPERQGIAGR